MFFFFNDTATTEIYTLSLHDALPICGAVRRRVLHRAEARLALLQRPLRAGLRRRVAPEHRDAAVGGGVRVHLGHHARSEEHTSELQSRQYLVCRLLLEKKKNNKTRYK